MLEKIGSLASIIGILREVASLRGLFARKAIRIETTSEAGPTTRRSGFAEPAVKIIDIRLMFCGEYGVPVELEAPPGRFHPVLPVDLDSGSSGELVYPCRETIELAPFNTSPALNEYANITGRSNFTQDVSAEMVKFSKALISNFRWTRTLIR